ncbi:hypothetical protein [Desulfoluna limicola]|uniref:hypothetical protein n=1 Tax=Desulfoluna limicola TaxID=2810562 RepID=UPI001F1EBDCA|nr:hypothetical protein [Desulfoluna limicola]
MGGKCLDPIPALQLTGHALWEVAFCRRVTIRATFYFSINMLNDFFKNNINFRSASMPMAGDMGQVFSTDITGGHFGHMDCFNGSGVADFTFNLLSFFVAPRI